MKIVHYAAILSASMLFVGSLPARAWEVYKYRMPDGSVTYSHEVSTRGKLEDVIGAPPPDSAQIEQALRLKLKRDEDRANRIAAKRETDLNAVEAEIRDGTVALVTAKQELKAGLVPRVGEIRGTASRHTVLSLEYWRRVRALHLAVEDIRERLDDAYEARNALK